MVVALSQRLVDSRPSSTSKQTRAIACKQYEIVALLSPLFVTFLSSSCRSRFPASLVGLLYTLLVQDPWKIDLSCQKRTGRIFLPSRLEGKITAHFITYLSYPTFLTCFGEFFAGLSLMFSPRPSHVNGTIALCTASLLVCFEIMFKT